MRMLRVAGLALGFLLGFWPLVYLLIAAVFLETFRLVWRIFV